MSEQKKQQTKKSSDATIKINKTYLPTAIALIVLGVLFCAFRSSMLSILFTIVGSVLIAVGIIQIFNKDYATGAVGIAIGIVIITCGWTILDITLLVLGILTLVYGIYLFVLSVPKFKTAKGFSLAKAIIEPLVIVLIGILLIVSKWELSDAIFIVLGVMAILDGVFMLIKK